MSRLPLLVLAAATAAFSQPGTISTFAGAYPEGLGGPALQVTFRGGPSHLVQDPAGNTYILGLAALYRLGTDGNVNLLAGTGVRGSTGDGGPAVLARLNCGFYSGIVVDPGGNIIFAETLGHRIRRIDPAGIITTIAGTGTAGFSGDGGAAIAARFANPQGIALDSSGTLFVADAGNGRVRRISPDGIVTTVAGTGVSSNDGDGGPAAQASLMSPDDVAVHANGTLYIADYLGQRIRRVAPDGIITTIAGPDRPLSNIADALGNPVPWTDLSAITLDSAGNIIAAVGNHIVKIDSTGKATLVAGNGSTQTKDYEGPAEGASIITTTSVGLAIDRNGELLVGLSYERRVAKIDRAGRLSYIAGGGIFSGIDRPAAYAQIPFPSCLAIDGAGTVYVRNYGPPLIQRIAATGISKVVGDFWTDGCIAVDRQGNMYVSDGLSDAIEKIDTSGKITPFAGVPTPFGAAASYGGDGGPAVEAHLNNPFSMAFDPAGALYFVDTNNHRVRKVGLDGKISTVAGTGVAGFSGDGGPAASAQINTPNGIAFDSAGNLFFGDSNNNRIRKVTLQGTISTYAGTGQAGFTGDGGSALQARLSVRAIGLDAHDNLYFLEPGIRVRKITPQGIISTVAGNGTTGFGGDGGPAILAAFNNAKGMAVDPDGNIYIADQDSRRIRRVQGNAPFSVAPASLLFSTALGGAASSKSLTISTADGASRAYQISSSAAWLQAAPASGTVSSAQNSLVTVTVNPAALAKGTYTGILTIADSGSAAETHVTVTLTVSGTAQQLQLSQSGLAFSATVGGSAPPPQSIRPVNSGTGSLNWTVATSTLAGGANWLKATPASGRSDAGAVAPSVEVRADPTGLAAGTYYGLVTVTAPSADNSPQSAMVLFAVLPADQAPAPVLDPAGLVFTAAPGGSNPPNQSVQLANITTAAVTFTATATYPDKQTWFTLSPASGTVAAGAVQTLDIKPNITGIPAGTYRGDIAVRTQPGNLTRHVALVLVVAAGVTTGAGKETGAAAGAACTPSQLIPVFRSPGDGYTVRAGWPITVQVKVVDNCGNSSTRGSGVVSFNTTDPPISLTSMGDGLWTGTWAARQVQASGTQLTVQAAQASPSLQGTAKIAVGVGANPDQPLIGAGGVLNAASFERGTPIAPGSYISIFGTKLASSLSVAQSLPLPVGLSDTTALIAGRPLPLHFASDGQVNAIVPYGVADSTTQQIIIRRGTTYSLPEPVLVGASQPAVFAVDGSGKGQGHVYVYTADGPRLADSSRPAKPGEALIIYATGLGPVSGTVGDGQAAPSSPLAETTSRVKVTVQGKEAKIFFTGLAPGFVGLYQVNVYVPDGVRADSAAQLIVTAGESVSPAVTIAVEQ